MKQNIICILISVIIITGCTKRPNNHSGFDLSNIESVELRHGDEFGGLDFNDPIIFLRKTHRVIGNRVIGIMHDGTTILNESYDSAIKTVTIVYIGDGNSITEKVKTTIIELLNDIRRINSIGVDSIRMQRDKKLAVSPGNAIYSIVRQYRIDNK